MPAGRPTKRTPEIEMKLEQAFSLGSTVVSACFYAGIGETTYHDWARSDPEFSARMEALKQKPVLKALETVVNGLSDPAMARWYLEKRQDDFKPKQAVQVDGSLEIAGDLLFKKNADK